MSAAIEIPLSPTPQTLSVPLNGKVYRIRLDYADAGQGFWFIDISDDTGTPLVCGVPLLPGADILGQYAYLGIGGKMWIATDGDPYADVTFAGLGTIHHLYFEAD